MEVTGARFGPPQQTGIGFCPLRVPHPERPRTLGAKGGVFDFRVLTFGF